MFRRLAPFGVALATLALPSLAQAATSPNAIALRASDVPKNYRVILSSKQIAPELVMTKLKPKVYAKHGRLGGYVAEFAPKRSTPAVASLIVQYRNAAGAHWELQNVRARMNARHITASPVGNESFAFGYEVGKKKTQRQIYSLAFRRGAFAIEVTEIGKPNSITMDDVVRYARIVDARAKK